MLIITRGLWRHLCVVVVRKLHVHLNAAEKQILIPSPVQRKLQRKLHHFKFSAVFQDDRQRTSSKKTAETWRNRLKLQILCHQVTMLIVNYKVNFRYRLNCNVYSNQILLKSRAERNLTWFLQFSRPDAIVWYLYASEEWHLPLFWAQCSTLL